MKDILACILDSVQTNFGMREYTEEVGVERLQAEFYQAETLGETGEDTVSLASSD